MALIDKIKGKQTQQDEFSNKNYYNYKENQNTYTLELIKKSMVPNGSNVYLSYWALHKVKVDKIAKNAVVIDDVRNGRVPLYQFNTFGNTINNVVRNVKNETIIDVDVSLTNSAGEKTYYKDFDMFFKNLKLSFDKEDLGKIFETAWLYERCGVKINVIDKKIKFEVLKPYEYAKVNGGVICLYGDNGSLKQEVRTFDGSKSAVDGVEVPFTNGAFFEVTTKSDMYNKLETILAFDLVNSNIEKAIELGKGKELIDRKMFKNNPINSEVISIVDVPEGSYESSADKISSYYTKINPQNTLADLVLAKENKVKDLTNLFGLSAKTMGVNTGGKDLAIEVKYENDLTSKTVNALRDELSTQYQQILAILTGVDFDVDLGIYSLTSKDAVIETNSKAISGKMLSIIESQKGLYDDEEEAIKNGLIIKIENNMTLTLEEEIMAGDIGLLPKLVPSNDLGLDI